MNKKRIRSVKWDEEEKQLLRFVLKEYVHVIQNKAMDTKTIKLKHKAWEEVYKKFNELNDRHRQLIQLKIQWKTMKRKYAQKRRKTNSNFQREANEPDKGVRPATPSDAAIENLLNTAKPLQENNLNERNEIDIKPMTFIDVDSTCDKCNQKNQQIDHKEIKNDDIAQVNAPDLSDLVEAVPSTVNTDTTSQWTVAAHKRPCKREPVAGSTLGPKGKPERSRPNRRARRKALQPKSNTTQSHNVTDTAAAETQREPEPPTSTETAATMKALSTQPKPPPPQNRGQRTAAEDPNSPEKEQPGTGNGPKARASLKRSLLDETPSPRGDTKRAKTDAKPKRAVGYADATLSHLKVAVITVPSRDLTPAQAEQLRETIDDSILQAVLSPPSPGAQAPSFRGRPFLLDGVLAMWCENAYALGWLERAVKSIPSPIPDTTLAVVKQSELKKRIKAGLLIHTRITEAGTLQRVLCAQNPWYKVDSWQCYDMSVNDKPQEPGSKEKVVHLVLGIPEDQRQTILDRDRRVAHMSGSGYIRFFTSEDQTTADNKPATHSTAASASEQSSPAPQPGPSAMEANSPLNIEGITSDEDDVLRSP